MLPDTSSSTTRQSTQDSGPAHRPAYRAGKRQLRRILRRLGHIDILRALPAEEVQALAPHVEQLHLESGASLMREGETGDALYLIEEGEALVQPSGGRPSVIVGSGSVVGEAALLTGAPRSATVTAHTPLILWRIAKDDFDRLAASSPKLKSALLDLMEQRRTGLVQPLQSRQRWVSTALRAIDARSRTLRLWQLLMGIGMLLWLLMALDNDAIANRLGTAGHAALQLVTGLLIIQGACEAFVSGVERLGARLRWDGFVSGTIGSILSTLPEFVVIAFIVLVNPLAAFVTAVVTIFNNALAFSIYAFFLPKDRTGAYQMPRSLTMAGSEILVSGGAIALILGSVLLARRLHIGETSALAGWDLLFAGIVLIVIYGLYVLTLLRYYGEGKDDAESLPPDPERLGHDTSWTGIGSMLLLGVIGAYCGGEAIGGFAETALDRLGLPAIPTAAALAFFAGISEYVIVYKSHRRGELGIALSNVFGGIAQVMFLLLPFGLIVIGYMGLTIDSARFAVPANVPTILLLLLLFPLFHVLHQLIANGKSLSNLDAAAMSGIYVLLLYFLFFSPL